MKETKEWLNDGELCLRLWMKGSARPGRRPIPREKPRPFNPSKAFSLKDSAVSAEKKKMIRLARPKAFWRRLSLLGLFMGLFVTGCVGLNQGPGERPAEAAKGRFHSMNGEVILELVGSWKLVSFHSQDASGQTAYPFGKNAQGRLIYEPDGRMAVQLMNPNRPGFPSDDPLVTSEAEVRAAFGGYTAYYGTYSVNPDEGTIVHHIEASLLPNWVGTDQRRHFEFDGKVLTLKGPLILGGVQGVVSLVWERLP